MNTVVTGLLWFSAVGCGLLGGLYFAFSAFIMTSLGRIDRVAGIAAMNATNAEIVKSLFLPLFLLTTLAGAVLMVLAIVRWDQPDAVAMLLGGIVYVLGMFAVTMAFNVPLNNALAATDPSGAEAPRIWARYLRDWTLWNHVRTVACIAAAALFTAAISA